MYGSGEKSSQENSLDRMYSLEQPLLQHSHRCYDARFATGMQFVQLHVARDQRSDEFGIGRRPGTAASDVVGDVMDLFTVLIRHDRTFSGPCIGTQHDAILENAANDGRSCAGCLGQMQAFLAAKMGVARM